MGGAYQDVAWPMLGGLNEDDNPEAVAANELIRSENSAGRDSATGTRPGFNFEVGGDYPGQISGTPDIQGMFEFAQNNVFERDKFLTVAGGDVYVDDASGALTKGVNNTLSAGPNYRWTFATFQDKVLACGGQENVDSFWTWDGTGAAPGVLQATPIDMHNLGGALGAGDQSPKYILQKWGRLYVAGMNPAVADTDPSYNKMCVRYNEIGQDPTPYAWTNVQTSWPPGNTIGTGENVGDVGGLSEYGDEFITGLASYEDPSGDWMMICTNRGLASVRRLADGRHWIDSTTGTGLVHQHAWVNLGKDAGDAIYMSDQGIHSLRQSRQFGAREDTFLSWKIRNTFNSLDRSRFHLVSGAYDPQEGYVVFLVTGPNGSAEHDMLLCLDTHGVGQLTADTAKWHIWEMGGAFKMNLLRVIRDPTGKPRLYGGTTTGEIGHLSRTIYSDWGGDYACRFQTAHASFGAPWLEKSAGDLALDIQPGGDHKPMLNRVFDLGKRTGPTHAIDMAVLPPSTLGGAGLLGSTFVLGGIGDDTYRKRIYGTGAGSTIGLKFAHTSPNQPFFVANISQQIGGLGESGSTSTLDGS